MINDLLILKVKAESVEFALQANNCLQGLQQNGALVLAGAWPSRMLMECTLPATCNRDN